MDSLAEKRARDLNQDVEGWRGAVWDQAFQKISQGMTDGEVEAFVALCSSPEQLCSAAKYLEQQYIKSGTPPYTILSNEAANASVSVRDWVLRIGSQ